MVIRYGHCSSNVVIVSAVIVGILNLVRTLGINLWKP